MRKDQNTDFINAGLMQKGYTKKYRWRSAPNPSVDIFKSHLLSCFRGPGLARQGKPPLSNATDTWSFFRLDGTFQVFFTYNQGEGTYLFLPMTDRYWLMGMKE